MGIDRVVALLRQWPTFALLGLLWGCAALPEPVLDTFLQRRAACDHARGEFPDPPDPERVRDVEHQVVEYCTGTDAQLAALKKRYRLDSAVSQRLEAFEPHIEKAVK
jgi:hypothetical protein